MTAPTLEAERAAPELLPCPECQNDYLAIRTDIYKDKREFVYCDCCGCIAVRSVWNAISRTAAPVAEGVALPPLDAEGLPPLPEPKYVADNLADIYTAEQVRQAQREAVEADRRARYASNPIERACEILGAFPAAPSPLPPQEEANG